MRLRKVKQIFKKEILDTLRDRRTLFMMVVVPLLLYPGLLLFINSIATSQQAKMEEKTIDIALVRLPHDMPLVRLLRSDKKVHVVNVENARRALEEGRIHFIIQAPADFDRLLEEDRTAVLELQFDRANEDAAVHLDEVKDIINTYSKEILKKRLAAQSLSEEYVEPIAIAEVNVASQQKMGGFVIGRLLPMLMVFMVLIGSLYPSIDMTAGEKERGTLETILTSPATRSEIVIAKFLTVALIALLTGLLNLGSMVGTFVFGIFKDLPSAIQIEIPPAYLIIMVACLVPLAIFFAGVMMAIASFARSFKEAQNLVTPFYLVATLPAMISSIPGVKLEGFWLTLPIANVTLLFKELLVGVFDLNHILIVFFICVFFAALAIFLAIQLFGREEVLFGSASSLGLSLKRANIIAKPLPDSGEAFLFTMMALAFLIYMAIPLQNKDIISGLLVTEFGIFLFLPLAFAGYLKLDFKETFRLRFPSGQHILITLMLFGAIAFTAGTILYLQNRLFPFPKELLDFMEQLAQKIYSRPFWQVFLLMAVLPAVCEETTFRGMIQSGFLTRFRPQTALVLTAAIFAAFHLSLHRFPGVFLIGLAACYLVWISGSIFPGMLLHMLSNGYVSLLVRKPEYDWFGVEGLQPSIPFALTGVVLAALAFYWGNRTRVKKGIKK